MKKKIGYARLEVWWGIVLIVEINIKGISQATTVFAASISTTVVQLQMTLAVNWRANRIKVHSPHRQHSDW